MVYPGSAATRVCWSIPGGLISNAEGIDYLTAQQVHQAIDEAELVLFIVSARDGLTAEDEEDRIRIAARFETCADGCQQN